MRWWAGALGLERDTPSRKDVTSFRGGLASTENNSNFVTNQVTLADMRDASAQSGGNASGLAATWACVNLITGTIASLPLAVYRSGPDGVKKVAKDHTLYFILHDSPNYDQTAVDFWGYMGAGIELQGNAYAKMEKRSDGSIISLTPLRPDAVKVTRLFNGDLEYDWTENGQRVVRKGSEILHIRGPLGNALSGASALSVCRSSFDSAVHADRAASTMFANGIQPSGVLSTDPSISLTPEQREKFDEYLGQRFIGARNAGRPLLLDRGMKWTQMTMSPEDAQMLETRRFGVEEICRIFGVPPHMIGHSEKSTSWGTGLEQQTLGFVKFSLRQRLKRIEQALEKQLLTAADRNAGISIEFNLEGLLRGDSMSRAQFYQSGLQNGWRTINEVRALENLEPVEGGDVPRMQMQNVPLTADPGAQNAA